MTTTGAIANENPDSLDARERQRMKVRAVAASAAGTTIEWYDFFLYGVAAALVFPQKFFPESDPYVGTLLAFSTYFVGFVARPVGAALFGHFGDRMGRKVSLVATLMLMGLATIAIGLVPGYEQIGIWGAVLLTLLRVLQGIGGGPLLPLSQAILMEIFPPRERGTAMAIWGVGVMFAPIFGPTLGGWITDNYSWRWIFYLNVPIGLAALALAWLCLREPATRPPAVRRVDALGLGLLVLGIGTLQVALDRGNRLDWFESTTITDELPAAVAVKVKGLPAVATWVGATVPPIVTFSV